MKLPKGLLVFLAALALISSTVWLFNQRGAVMKRQDVAEEALGNSLRVRGQLISEQPGLQIQLNQAADKKEEWQIELSNAQKQLEQSEKDLAAAQTKLPGKIEKLDYNETLLAMCRHCGLEVTGMGTGEPDQTEHSGTAGFISNTFTLQVKGTVAQILDLYNTIVTDQGFRTASMAPVVIHQPLPMTDEMLADLADEFYTQLLSELEGSLTPEELVIMIEEAVLEMLDEESGHLPVDEMTQRILDVISADFGDKIAGDLAAEIASALENELAGTLISIIADTYADAIGELFTEGDPILTPEITGLLGKDITDKLLLMPPDKVAGVVASVISDKLNNVVRERIEGMVDLDEVARRVAEIVEQEGMSTGTITITVTTYEGGADVQG